MDLGALPGPSRTEAPLLRVSHQHRPNQGPFVVILDMFNKPAIRGGRCARNLGRPRLPAVHRLSFVGQSPNSCPLIAGDAASERGSTAARVRGGSAVAGFS